MFDFTPFAIQALSLLSRGSALHRSALQAMRDRRWRAAELLFEAAAQSYRRELEVEALARARVHQLMSHVLSGAHPGHEAEDCLEVERGLSQLECIESLAPPFPLVEARTMLASWLAEAPGGPGRGEPPLDLARAA